MTISLWLIDFLKIWISFIAINVLTLCHASDSYDGATGVLSIPVVNVGGMGGSYYSNVSVTVGSVLVINTTNRSSQGFDTYDAATNQLSIPSVNVAGTIYSDVVITVGHVLSVGRACVSALDCGVVVDAVATVSSGSGGTSPAVTGTASNAASPFASWLLANYSATTLQSATGFTTRTRYLVSDSASALSTANYLTFGPSLTTSVGYAVKSAQLLPTSALQNYLNSIVEVVAASDGNFMITSHLNPNQSIDFDSSMSNAINFRNNFGLSSKYYGYITFAYNNTSHTIQAKSRYLYSLASTTSGSPPTTAYTAKYTADPSFTATNHYLNLTNGQYTLTSSLASASKFYLYLSPIDFGIPADFGTNYPYQTNSTAPFFGVTSIASVEGMNGLIYRNLQSKYQHQVINAGSDATTKKNTDAMLATIQSNATKQGFTLRYSPSVYTAYRDATLKSVLKSDSIADGTVGQNLVPYVYYTNEMDSAGQYHPFMVIVSYGNPSSPNHLLDIPRPPGSDRNTPYQSSRVTRLSNLVTVIAAIPLRDYGVVSKVTDNVFSPTLWSEAAGTKQVPDVYNYASTDENGILIDGSSMFPVYNNGLFPSQAVSELSVNGCHVGGGGGGPHCHADSYQSGPSTGIGVYTDADYVGQTHPPIIGFGFDGVALFGLYRLGTDASMLGYKVALDSFGAHNHDGIGNHYHAHTVPNFATFDANNSPVNITLHVYMKGAWVGNINSVPDFRKNGSNTYLGMSTPK
jgi:hypothetical protein